MNRLFASLAVVVPLCSFVTADGNAAAKKPPYVDNDPGSSGLMHDAHENEIVFSNVAIPKKDGDSSKLIVNTTLLKPLYVRMFSARTIARVLNENEQSCDHAQIRAKWMATLEGSSSKTASVYLREGRPSDNAISAVRTTTVLDSSGKQSISIVPQSRVSMSDSDDTLYPRFLALTAQMKPGKNVVTFSYQVGCEGHPGKNKQEFSTIARGSIVINVQPGELAAFVKNVGPDLGKSTDVAAETRIRPLFDGSVAKGSKTFSFSANATAALTTKKDTVVSAFVKNADGQCTYTTGHWIEPYVSGAYGAGHYEVSTPPALIPCP